MSRTRRMINTLKTLSWISSIENPMENSIMTWVISWSSVQVQEEAYSHLRALAQTIVNRTMLVLRENLTVQTIQELKPQAT